MKGRNVKSVVKKKTGFAPELRDLGRSGSDADANQDMSLPRAEKARAARDPEETNALEILDQARRNVETRQAATSAAKRGQKRTPAHKSMHAVDNEGVHNSNSSARQADSVSEIDRDADHPTTWQRSSNLSAPTTRPGMTQKWVRYRGKSDTGAEVQDTDNLERHYEEGWRPRKRETVRRGHELTAAPNDKFASCYVKRGLILMEIPEKLAIQRRRFYQKNADRMTEGIDRNMFRINHPAMPFLQPSRSTRVTKVARRGSLEDQEAAASDAN